MNIAELKYKEYLTPFECKKLFGRGESFWKTAFLTNRVRGYRGSPKGKSRAFHLEADSCREFLRSLSEEKPKNKNTDLKKIENAVSAAIANSVREYEQNGIAN